MIVRDAPQPRYFVRDAPHAHASSKAAADASFDKSGQ
jgi:hypothetical protein